MKPTGWSLAPIAPGGRAPDTPGWPVWRSRPTRDALGFVLEERVNVTGARRTLLAVLVLSTLATTAQALKPEAAYPATPGDYGIVFEDVTFEASDGVSLHGWFFPAQDTTGIATRIVGRLIPVPEALRREPRPYATLDDQPRATVIVCCGDAGNMSYLMLYAYQLCTRGFNVLTFDWRGFGASDAWPTDADVLSYAEYLLDYEAAIDYLLGRDEVDQERIGLFGFSTGAYLSFGVAAKRKDIAAIAVRGLITSFDDALPILNRIDPDRALSAPSNYPDELIPVKAALTMTVPTLLIVGEDDTRTPPWMSERVHGELKGPKELWIVEGAGHGGQYAPEYVNYPEFFVRLGAFFGKYLGVSR
jgi:fermentation-respiration switch protein FrsA (DUF1100 family)